MGSRILWMDMIPPQFSYRRTLPVAGGFFLCIFGIIFLLSQPRVMIITNNDQVQTAKNVSVTSTTQNPTSTPLFVADTMPAFIIASATPMLVVPMAPVDIAAYDAKILTLANLPPPRVTSGTTTSTVIKKPGPWPVRSAPYPGPGALLPFNRIVAYYGNLYSKQMGVLGQYPIPQMLAMLTSTTAQWSAADPSTPVIPALDYIAVTAQASAGVDGKYRARMPASELDRVIGLAARVNAIVIFELQVGLSSVQKEIALLDPYLKLPQVHLALDPEFDMPNGEKPGTIIGTMDAADVNYAANYLAQIVKENNLPPKILIVHRFTQAMLTNYKKIMPLPEVQIVIDMDGFGYPAKKIGTYTHVVIPEPVQFTGFKLFYKNDAVAGHLMTPAEVLKLSPQPSFIQYQ